MANTIISPNMSMPVPVVGVDPGPDWATDVNACLSIIDSHNHTAGDGVPITPDAMDINADLPMNNNNLITAKTVRFNPQSTVLSNPADLGCLYEVVNDLYYNDGAGNHVRITQSGSVAGATGTITGLPSGTASASFSGTTFTFQSATNTPATMSVGPIIIAQPVLNGFGVTITPSSSQAANYDFTLPISLPTVPSFFKSDSSGNMGFVPTGANIRGGEGAGTTTLTNSDNPWQIFNTTGARICVLPSTGITAGQEIKIENVGSGGTLEVQSSNTNSLCFVNSLYSTARFIALQNSPTALAHWKIDFSYNEVPYLHGTTYYNGIAPTVSLSIGGFTTTNCTFIPYQLQTGSWRLRANLNMFHDVSPGFTTTINGITFLNSSQCRQAITAWNPGGAFAIANANINASSFDCVFGVSDAASNFSFDLILNAKPTWAY